MSVNNPERREKQLVFYLRRGVPMKGYVKFEVSPELVDKTYKAVEMSKDTGKIKKGANEVTKSIERGMAKLVIIAEDVDPEEIVMHIPMLCEEKKIAYTFVPEKKMLGKACGLEIQCSALSIEKEGNGKAAIEEIVKIVEPKMGKKA
jgi:large subunit ribosomal protein L7Ae